MYSHVTVGALQSARDSIAMASGASQPVTTAAPLDDTGDASSVKGRGLKRPVRSTAMDGDVPQLAEAGGIMPKGWMNEKVGPIVIWRSPNGKIFRSCASACRGRCCCSACL